MIRILCAIVVCFGLLAAPEPVSGQGRWDGRVVVGQATQPECSTCEKPHPAVARIWVKGRNAAGSSVGTAVLVGKRAGRAVVLTVRHLFDGARKPFEIIIEFPNGERFKGAFLDEDKAPDLAAVMLAEPSAEPVAIHKGVALAGERTTAAGYGSGCYRSVAGRLKGYRRVPDGTNQWLVTSGGIRRGDSGGPVFLASSGELLGILWGTTDSEAYGTCNVRLTQFIAPWNAWAEVEKERMRQSLVPVQPQQPATVLPGPAIDSTARSMAQDALNRVAGLERSIGASVADASQAANAAASKANEAVAGIADIQGVLSDKVIDAAQVAAKPMLLGWANALGLGALGWPGTLGVGVAVFFGWRFLRKDKRQYKSGEDPSVIQTITAWTPWTWDDGLGNVITQFFYGPQNVKPPEAPAQARPGMGPVTQANPQPAAAGVVTPIDSRLAAAEARMASLEAKAKP